jgi:hypothetical protein
MSEGDNVASGGKIGEKIVRQIHFVTSNPSRLRSACNPTNPSNEITTNTANPR